MLDRESKTTLLLISSNRSEFEAIVQLLAHEHFEIRVAQDSNQALIDLLDHPTEFVIVDVEASGGINLDLVPVIKRLRPKIKLIVFLDSRSMEDIGKVIGCGISYHALKPENEMELVEIVKAIRSRLSRRLDRVNSLASPKAGL